MTHIIFVLGSMPIEYFRRKDVVESGYLSAMGQERGLKKSKEKAGWVEIRKKSGG